MQAGASRSCTVVLLPGSVKVPDRVGHHDYRAGCALLAELLERSPGVRAVVAEGGWPEDESLLEGARSLVFYNGGAGKHPFLQAAGRTERLQRLFERGVGLVLLHRAVRFPAELAPRAIAWAGGAHVAGVSARGHWRTHHQELPPHPVMHGVAPWRIRDGWLHGIRFAEGMRGVTPLVWAGPRYRGSSRGGAADVVSWAFERPGGGRAFCYTGLDAHSAFAVDGVRQLTVNGILWSAGCSIPETGAPCRADRQLLRAHLTPRGSWPQRLLRGVTHALR